MVSLLVPASIAQLFNRLSVNGVIGEYPGEINLAQEHVGDL